MSLYVRLLVEGTLDEMVLRRVLSHYREIQVDACFGKQGKSFIEQRIDKFNQAANRFPHIGLVDLDQEVCPSALIRRLLPHGIDEQFILRVAIREIESWLIADRDNLSAYLGVAANKLPIYPENEPNPKEAIVSACRSSKNKTIREGIVPQAQTGSKIGPAYVTLLENFALTQWDVTKARQQANSLNRAMNAIQRFIDQPR
ncbi:MAG: DUF4276 family protein [Anaerolineae bacterium]|jgi:hypothetical protein|nr:DUF4276 family protein [Anaerolineae bacterium]